MNTSTPSIRPGQAQGTQPRSVRPLRDSLIFSGGYATTAGLWILVSDVVLASSSPVEDPVAFIGGLLKGQGFVVVTSIVLFVVSYRYLTRLKRSEDRFLAAQTDLREKEQAVRQGYVDVLDAVTGGKLILLTQDELDDSLGTAILSTHPLNQPSELSSARHEIKAVLQTLGLPEIDAAVLAVSEALTNALKHAGSGEYEVCRTEECAQIVVHDFGRGIDFRTLPKATLVQGFSTTNTLGMGFTIMLEVCDRVLLTTGGEGTTVVMEIELPESSSSGELERPGKRRRSLAVASFF